MNEVSQRVSEIQTRPVGLTLGWSQFTKGHNSVKTVDGVMVLNLYTSSDDAIFVPSFKENITKDFTVIKQMSFAY